MWDPSRFALSRLVWLCRECHCWVEGRRTLAQGLGCWSVMASPRVRGARCFVMADGCSLMTAGGCTRIRA